MVTSGVANIYINCLIETSEYYRNPTAWDNSIKVIFNGEKINHYRIRDVLTVYELLIALGLAESEDEAECLSPYKEFVQTTFNIYPRRDITVRVFIPGAQINA